MHWLLRLERDDPKCERCAVVVRDDWTLEELYLADMLYFNADRNAFLVCVKDEVAAALEQYEEEDPLYNADVYLWCPVSVAYQEDECIQERSAKLEVLNQWLLTDIRSRSVIHTEKLIHTLSTGPNDEQVETYTLDNRLPFHLLRIPGLFVHRQLNQNRMYAILIHAIMCSYIRFKTAYMPF